MQFTLALHFVLEFGDLQAEASQPVVSEYRQVLRERCNAYISEKAQYFLLRIDWLYPPGGLAISICSVPHH